MQLEYTGGMRHRGSPTCLSLAQLKISRSETVCICSVKEVLWLPAASRASLCGSGCASGDLGVSRMSSPAIAVSSCVSFTTMSLACSTTCHTHTSTDTSNRAAIPTIAVAPYALCFASLVTAANLGRWYRVGLRICIRATRACITVCKHVLNCYRGHRISP